MGTGIGRALFAHVVQRAAEQGAAVVELEADPHAAGFYERLGAQRVGERRSAMAGLERNLPLFLVEVARRT
jgi:ribosomal protein S18 acetylase RimI-like enzyme